MKLHLIMPMGGAGTRFLHGGLACPKPLLPLRGQPFFWWATESVLQSADVADVTFVVLRQHVEQYAIDREIRSRYPDAAIVVLDKVLPGAVLTCLAGIARLPQDEPVLLNDCDHAFRSNALRIFCQSPVRADGALLTFSSDSPAYSYVAYDEAGRVTRTAEKEVISHDAICGAYYISSAALFRRCAEAYLTTCRYQEYFLSGVYNELLRVGYSVASLPTDYHIPFGTPEEYEAARHDARLEAL